jgi:hypothetical protein
MIVTRNCDNCGKRYRARNVRFCSGTCRTTWINNNVGNPAKTAQSRQKVSAARMGKPTTTGRITPQSQRDNISKALLGRPLSIDHKAAIGAGVKRAGNIPPRNTHLIGPAHPAWKGGHTPARMADFHSPAYKAFRDAVRQRDDWTCQDCGKRGGKVEIHHIASWAEHPSLRYEPSNAVCLCHPCHKTRHRGVPRIRGAGPRTRAELRLGRREA